MNRDFVPSPNEAVALSFVDSFNHRDLGAFVATLHPEVEIHAGRGLRKGIEAARDWGTRAPGGVQQRIVVEELRERGDIVVALILREWWWEDDPGEQAGTDVMAWLFEFRGGQIASWRSFDDRDEALAALS